MAREYLIRTVRNSREYALFDRPARRYDGSAGDRNDSMGNLHELSAAELGRRYADGSLSPVEVTRALLARIEACEPKINAMYRVRTEDALAQARAAEARWRSQSRERW